MLKLLCVFPFPPFPQINHHNPSVEIARFTAPKRRRSEDRVRPESRSEVVGEVSVAILRRAEHVLTQIDVPQLRHVIDDDQVGVEVDDSPDAGGEEIGEVDPRVVERLVQSSANGVGDLALDDVDVEVVEVEAEVRESGGDDSAEFCAALGRDEMEDDVLRARGVLKNGEYAGN